MSHTSEHSADGEYSERSEVVSHIWSSPKSRSTASCDYDIKRQRSSQPPEEDVYIPGYIRELIHSLDQRREFNGELSELGVRAFLDAKQREDTLSNLSRLSTLKERMREAGFGSDVERHIEDKISKLSSELHPDDLKRLPDLMAVGRRTRVLNQLVKDGLISEIQDEELFSFVIRRHAAEIRSCTPSTS